MPFFRRGPQPPTQAISTKLKLEPITVKKKKPVHFHVHWFILSVTTGSLYLRYMDYSYSSAISIAKTYILKKYSYMHPSEFLNLWIFNVYLVTCSLLFKTYFIKKKRYFFHSENYEHARILFLILFSTKVWVATKPETQVNEQLRRNEDRVLQVNGYTADDYCAMILMIERFIINLTLAGHF